MQFLRGLILSLLFVLKCGADAQSKNISTDKARLWISVSDSRLQICGLPWFNENAPELWRLPKSAKERIPSRVWDRAIAPDGGRIRFASDTSSLAMRVEFKGREKKKCFIDAYLDDDYAGSIEVTNANPTGLTFFENKSRVLRQITIYFPNNHEVRVSKIAVDADAKFESSQPFPMKQPIVCYGSSVLQGTGAMHPAKTYPAILARRLNCDFVNLGFGGAGKAEPEVVELVNQLDARCFLFDLGKSYGDQSIEPYRKMLTAIRKSHASVPIICVTPIYSLKEENEPAYREISEKLRALMREAANDQQRTGDKKVFVIEGLELFGPSDKNFFSDLLHPNDEGNERLTERLAPRMQKILSQEPVH